MTHRFRTGLVLGSIVGFAAALLAACGDDSAGGADDGGGSGGHDHGSNAGAGGEGGDGHSTGGNQGDGGTLGEGGAGGQGGSDNGDPTDVHGRVIDAGGNPVAGAKIQVANTVLTTKADGRFQISHVSPSYDLIAVLPDGSKVDVFRSVTKRDPVVRFTQLGSKRPVMISGSVTGAQPSETIVRVGAACDDGSMASVTLSSGTYQFALLTSGVPSLNCELIALESSELGYVARASSKLVITRDKTEIAADALALVAATDTQKFVVLINDYAGGDPVDSHWGPFGTRTYTNSIKKDALDHDYLEWSTTWPAAVSPDPLAELTVQTDVQTDYYTSRQRWDASQQPLGFGNNDVPIRLIPQQGESASLTTVFTTMKFPENALFTVDFAFTGLTVAVHEGTAKRTTMTTLLPDLSSLDLELPKGAATWAIETSGSGDDELKDCDGALVEMLPVHTYWNSYVPQAFTLE